jgi:NADH-quinone oxidoreductase subunit G
VISDIAARCGLDFGLGHPGDAFAMLAAAVPFYAGLSLEAIGGRGIRWPERAESTTMALESAPPLPDATPPAREEPSPAGMLALGTYRPLWASPEVEVSPALKYLVPHQQVELSPEDASRLQIADGDEVVVGQNGTRLSARAHVRSLIPAGSAFLAVGLAAESANALTAAAVEVHKP